MATMEDGSQRPRRAAPLSEADRQRITALQADSSLPPKFAELAEWMLVQGEKGEQEGYL